MSKSPVDIARERRALLDQARKAQEEERLRVELPHIYGFKPYKWTIEYWRSTNRMKFICAANQISKANAACQDILTTDGWKKISDVQIGDYVFNREGKPVKVIGIPFDDQDDCYRFTFNDGSSTIVSKDHVWIAKDKEARFRRTYVDRRERSKSKGKSFANKNYGKWSEFSTLDIISKGSYSPQSKPVNRFVIPICEPIERPELDLFDPYYVGLYIGNGFGRSITFNRLDSDLILYGSKYGKTKLRKRSMVTTVTGEALELVKKVNLFSAKSSDKLIPEKYLDGSIAQRKSLLAGLLDTDGTVSRNGQSYSYSTTSEKLSQQIKQLVTSLGGIAEIKQKESYYKKDGVRVKCRDHFTISIWTKFNPFRSQRKSARWKFNERYKHERVIVSIEPLGKMPCRCLMLDSSDGSFLVTKDFIVNRNSSSQIRHAIDLATDPSKWDLFFPKRRPKVFWYLYPDINKVTEEFNEKWVKEFLPKGNMKHDPQFGWQVFYRKSEIAGIKFNSGVTLYFKTWRGDLQSATIDALFIDEEPPSDIWPELAMRVTRYDGMISMVFTATLNQPFFYDVIERRGQKDERFPQAAKWQISMEHDCRFYADGTLSPWTAEEVEKQKAKCGTQTEIDRRIHGRFVSELGLQYPSFLRKRNVKTHEKIQSDWDIYSGVDIGAGGPDAHPAAISVIAVRPDYKKARLVRFWKGNRKATTNSSQILNKYIEMTSDLSVTKAFYDWGSKEFGLRASEAGVAFEKAEKARDFGIDLLNTLFKNDMLEIDQHAHAGWSEDSDENNVDRLCIEFETLRKEANKSHAEDDGSDSLRYGCSKIPFDLSDITAKTANNEIAKEKQKTLMDERVENAIRQARSKENEDEEFESNFDDIYEEFNELME